MIQSKKLILFCSLLAICVFSAPIDDDDNDVELDDEQLREYTAKGRARQMGSEPLKNRYKWHMSKQKPYRVIVPFLIREEDYTTEALENFRAGLKDIEEKTCVRFFDRQDHHKDFIFVHDNGDGKCSSRLGRTGGQQSLKMRNDCMLIRKKCVHEIIHALGFHHMHQRYDRDDSLIIKWDNIIQENWHSFTKLNNEWEAYNTPYDVWSCMHYKKDGFSKNGNNTIETVNPEFQDEIGVQFTLSDGDAQRINLMYQCPKKYLTTLSQNENEK